MWNRINKKTLTVVALALGLAGCGDTYRPVVIPIPRPGPDPGNPGFAVTLHRGVPATGAAACDNVNVDCLGALSRIDLVGDLNLGNRKVNPGATTSSYLVGFTSSVVLVHPEFDSVTIASTLEFENVSSVFSLPAGSRPVHATTAAVGGSRYAFVAMQGARAVAFININDNRVTNTVDVGGEPNHVAVATPLTTPRVYASDQSTGTVDVIDVPSATLLTSIDVPGTPGMMLVTPNNKYLFVATSGAANTLTIINTETNTVTGSVPLGGAPSQIVYDARLLRVYSANPSANSISAVDVSTPTGRKLRDVPVGTQPVALAVLPDGSRVYTANRGSNDVSVVTVSGLQESGPPPTVLRAPAEGTIGAPVSLVASSDGTRVGVATQGPTQVGTTTYPMGTVLLRTTDNAVVTVLDAPYQNTIDCPSTNAEVQAVCETQRAVPLEIR